MAENVQSAVEDMLRVEREAVTKLRGETRDLLTEIQKDRTEQEKERELLKDLIRELDRLTERASIQLKALALLIERVS